MEQITVTNPYDESVIDKVDLMDEKAAKAALACAYELYQDRDSWLPPYHRRDILENFLALLIERKETFALAAAAEGGKPLVDSRVEVDRAIQGVKIAIEHIAHLTGKEVAMNQTLSSAGRIAYTFREPVGVVFAISAFNHPFNLIIHQVIPAIAAGCPVLVKPASSTPLSCLNIINLLKDAGLPDGWCQPLICKNTIAEHIVSDGRISFLSFIGSGKVGWYLRSKLAPGATCALEHGGAAPVIVEADVDIDQAVPLLTKGGFYHAGQVCVSVQRIFAHHKVAKSLAKKIADAAKALNVGDPRMESTDVGPLIDKREVVRVDEWVQQAVYKGAKLLCGGKKISDTCYEPTVLLDPPMDIHVSKEEIFGPVVCVYSYKKLEDAIDAANQLPFCFQASVFTETLDVALHCIRHLNATAVMVNDHTAFRVDWMPFGGRKHSGMGTGGIPYSMHEMTYEKMMVIHSSVL